MAVEMLRAEGSLTYLEFTKLIEVMWNQAHPDIPFYAVGTQKERLKYPCLLYKLELRETMSGEKKPRFREGLDLEDQSSLIVRGWRFKNIIQFIALNDAGPEPADVVIEAFEDFMLECTPVFKRLGLSDIFYGRREPDGDFRNTGNDIVRRTLTYVVITEKVTATSVDKLRQIEIDARLALESKIGEDIRTIVELPFVQSYGMDVFLS